MHNELSTLGVMTRQTWKFGTVVRFPSHHTMAWSAYHASIQDEYVPSDCYTTTLTQLLPLFIVKAATPVEHGISVLATEFSRYQLWHLTHPHLPLQSLFSGNGLKRIEKKTNLLQCLVAYTLRWQCGEHKEII